MIVPGPEPFSAYTTPEFWDDPHISAQMLRHHLDPDSDASSRSHAFIERSVVWLVGLLSLREGSRVLDLGCGPGLYALGLARLGARVVGVDVSRRSLGHLLEASAAENLPIETVHGSYLEADLDGPHDAAILIYEDYCALNPAQRHLLLTRVHEALRPGGQLVFDVTAAPAFASHSEGVREFAATDTPFWAPGPYRGVHETWTYPEIRLVLNRFIITADGSTREFWNWMQCLTADEVAAEVRTAGFAVEAVYGDVAGAPFDPSAVRFAVHAARS